MKESIGQAFLVNLILIFFLVLILMLLGSINYSKAYKVKNRIITILEKYGTDADDGSSNLSAAAKDEIDVNLKKAGYANSQDPLKCDKYADGGTLLYPKTGGGGLQYHYCVIRKDATDGSYPTPTTSTGVTYKDARYYKVVTFMEFNIPLLGGYLKFPVQGETKLIYEVIS